MKPERLGKYEILEVIGRGAMGEVYRAVDPVLGRSVAVKTMASKADADPQLRLRFQREAQSAARLNHPNIVTVFDLGEEHGQAYIAMELLDGMDLRQAIAQQALSGLDAQLAIMEQVAEGLAFAHAREVIHRDVKPANIHLLADGHVKLMDFGLARLGASELTATGMVLGTPNYMSPEQVRGEKADARSDIFSTGAVFYELLCNHRAFDADSIHAVLFQVLEHEPRPLRNWVPDLPQPVVDLVEVCLAKDPASRFPDGSALRDALRPLRWAAEGGAKPTYETMASLAPARRSLVRGPQVTGSSALAVALAEPEAPRIVQPRTLSKSAPTHNPLRVAVLGQQRSRLAYVGSAAAAVVVLGASAYWFWPDARSAAPSPVALSPSPPLAQASGKATSLIAPAAATDRVPVTATPPAVQVAASQTREPRAPGRVSPAQDGRADPASQQARVPQPAVRSDVPAPAPAPPVLSVTPSVPVPPPALPVTTPRPQLPTAPAATPVYEEPLIRKTIADYARAIEGKDIGLFRSVMPGISKDEERRLNTAFRGDQRQQVEIDVESIEVRATEATVRLARRDTIDGRTHASRQTMTLAKVAGVWVIRRIGK